MTTQTSDFDFERTENFKRLYDENRKSHAETMKNILNSDVPKEIKHPKLKNVDRYGGLEHPIYSQQDINNVAFTHYVPKNLSDRLAYITVLWIRFVNDLMSGWMFGRVWGWFPFTETLWLLRICLYESIGNVPGTMFAIVRHIDSIRFLRRDYGWIESLLLEANNERMHLLFALHLYKPNIFFRYFIIVNQYVFSFFLGCAYFINHQYCHRFAAYLEEAAVLLYSELLNDIEKQKFPIFEHDCIDAAKEYYQLPNDAKWRDVFANIRCDEAYHREVHHKLAPLSLKPQSRNPFFNENFATF